MTSKVELHLAEDNRIITNVSNGDSFYTKLGKPEMVQATLADASVTEAGTATFFTASLDKTNRKVTFAVTNFTGGTAYVTVKGRL